MGTASIPEEGVTGSLPLKAAIILLLLAGLGLAAYGITTLSLPMAFSWSHEGGVRYALTLALCIATVWGGSRLTHMHPIKTTALLAALVALCVGGVGPLLTVLGFGLSSLALGRLAVGRFTADPLVHLLSGAALYATAVSLIVHLPVNVPALYALMLIAPLIAARAYIANLLHATWQSLFIKTEMGSPIEFTMLSVAGAVALIYLLVAFMPELGHDALATHLFIPLHVAFFHQWHFDPSLYAWAVMPAAVDWLYTIIAMIGGGESGTRLLNLGFVLMLAALVRELVAWAAPEGTPPARLGQAKAAATLLLLASPLTMTEGASLFIESGWAMFFIGGMWLLLRGCTARSFSQWLPVGLLLGAALASKAVSLSLLPVLALPVLLTGRAWWQRESFKRLCGLLVVLLAAGSIPYITAYVITGNPLFPFLNGVFKSPYFPPENFSGAALFARGLSWDTFFNMQFDSGRYLEAYPGAGGLQWLVLLPAAIGIGLFGQSQRRALLLITMAILMIAGVFHETAYLRYIYPCYALIAAAIGTALLTGIDGRWPRTIGHAAGIATIAGNLFWLNAGSFYADFPLKTLASPQARDDYLATRLPMRRAIDAVNALNTEHSTVADFGPALAAGLKADVIYPNWYNSFYQRDVNDATTPEQLAHLLTAHNVTYVLLETEGDKALVDRVTAITKPLARFGTFEVRLLDERFLFTTELLKNPALDSLESWNVASPANFDTAMHTLKASVSDGATQAVTVRGGQRYKAELSARCLKDTPAEGRIQVIWATPKGKFLKADIVPFACTPGWQANSAIFTAPAQAGMAIFYIAGHTEAPLEFNRASFRQ